MMTRLLQLLLVAAALAGLVVFGFIRDKREHSSSAKPEDNAQESLPFSSNDSKLKDDMRVGHLFFDHRNNLRAVDLRYAAGDQLAPFFQRWLDEYPDPPRQRTETRYSSAGPHGGG